MTSAHTLTNKKANNLSASTLPAGMLEEIYDKHAPTLYGFLLRLVKDEFIANDALLECFSRIKTTCLQYNGCQESLLSVLLQHARQVAQEKIRTRQYRYELLANELYKCQLYLHDNQPADLYEEAKKIDTPLPEASKAILDQLYFNGLTIEEIAAKLALTQDQVKKHFADAVIVLRNSE